jgi:uncharacterized protein YcgL (UPF0745 family)
MICYVYRSNRKRDTYLYIQEEGDFSCLPDTILAIFGSPEYALSFDLHADRKLSQADAREVINKLETEGFYLQLPKSDFDLAKIEQQIVQSVSKNSQS